MDIVNIITTLESLNNQDNSHSIMTQRKIKNLGHQLQNVDQVVNVVCLKCFHVSCCFVRDKASCCPFFDLRIPFLMLPTQGVSSRELSEKTSLGGRWAGSELTRTGEFTATGLETLVFGAGNM